MSTEEENGIIIIYFDNAYASASASAGKKKVGDRKENGEGI